LAFLAELALQEKVTSMNPDNLSIVFAPNLLRTDETDPNVLLKNSPRVQLFTRTLIVAWGHRKK